MNNYHSEYDQEDDGDRSLPSNYYREYEQEDDSDRPLPSNYHSEYDQEDDGDRPLPRNYHGEYEREDSEDDGDRPLTKNYDREYEREDSRGRQRPSTPSELSFFKGEQRCTPLSVPAYYLGRKIRGGYLRASQDKGYSAATSDEMRGSYPHSRTSEYQPLPESINFNDPETNEREYDRDEDDRGSYAGGNYCEYGSARTFMCTKGGRKRITPPSQGATQRHLQAGVHPAIGPRRHLGQGDICRGWQRKQGVR